MKTLAPNRRQAGFTIVEMMIATVVFSVILIVVTMAILQFSKQYQKGTVAAATQDVARSLLDDVSRSLSYNKGGWAQLGSNGYCIGSAKRYSYQIGKQVIDNGALGPNQARHALVSDTTLFGCNSTTAPVNFATLPQNLAFSSSGLHDARELLGERMRLSRFDIDPPVNGMYKITIRVVYGDDDLLCSPAADDCNSNTTSSNLTSNDLTCKLKAGSQFCSVSELSTTVRRRVD